MMTPFFFASFCGTLLHELQDKIAPWISSGIAVRFEDINIATDTKSTILTRHLRSRDTHMPRIDRQRPLGVYQSISTFKTP
jgi:hypothetical protein